MFDFRKRRAAPPARRVVSRFLTQGHLALEPLEERALLSLGAPINTPVGTDPVGVAVADFNFDGYLDAAVIDHGAGTATGDLRVLLGQGDGTFVSGGAYRVGVSPVAVAVGDFNDDGIPDIVVASTVSPAGTGGQLSVLLGRGDGTFQTPVSTQLIGTPTALAVTDYNGDGYPDVAVTEVGDGRTTGVYVLLGNGNGTFQQGAHFPIANVGKPTAVTAADLDFDGIPDIAATVTPPGGTGFVSVWLSGDPTQAPRIYPVGVNPSSIAVADFNGDGVPDLAVANKGANIAVGSVSILYGNGDGTFQNAVNYEAGPGPTNVVVGDFNGDGLPDLAVSNPNPTTVINGVTILSNDGAGGFTAPEFYRAGIGPTGLAVGDFNNDGYDDLIVTNAGSNDVSVLLQKTNAAVIGNRSVPVVVSNRGAAAEAALVPGASVRAAEEEYFQLLAGEATGHHDAVPMALARSMVTLRPRLSALDLTEVI